MLTEWQPIEVRRCGRLSVRWVRDVRAGMGKMKIQNWCKMVMDREAWERTGDRAKTHEEL
jgi:hypothetical protein